MDVNDGVNNFKYRFKYTGIVMYGSQLTSFLFVISNKSYICNFGLENAISKYCCLLSTHDASLHGKSLFYKQSGVFEEPGNFMGDWVRLYIGMGNFSLLLSKKMIKCT